MTHRSPFSVSLTTPYLFLLCPLIKIILVALATRGMFKKPSTQQRASPPAVVSPGRASHGGEFSSEEESLAFSLIMLSRGIREEPARFFADVAAPALAHAPPDVNAVAAPAPASAIHSSTSESEPPSLHSQEQQPVASPPRQTPAPVVAVVTSPTPAQVVAVVTSQPPVPVVAIVTSPAPALVVAVVTSPTPEPEIAPSRAPENVATAVPTKVPKATTRKASKPAAAEAPRKAPKALSARKKTPVGSAASESAPAEPPGKVLVHDCPVCSKEFRTPRGLSAHMQRHPDGRLHPCEFCTTTFPSAGALLSHVRRSDVCGGSKPRRLSPIAAAAIAWDKIDLNLP